MLNISGKALTAIIGVTIASTVTVCAVANPATFAPKAYATDPTSMVSDSGIVSSEPVSSEESSKAYEIISSVASEVSTPGSSQAVSSKTVEQQTNEGVSKIKETTDDGVSKIQAATSEAIAEVKKVTGETVSTTSSAAAHKVVCGENRITGTSGEKPDGSPNTWFLECQGYLSKVDEDNKCVIISYGGSYPGKLGNVQTLIDGGFKLTNAAGSEIAYESYKFCKFKIPYINLSDVAEMYFCYEDQKIKITVS